MPLLGAGDAMSQAVDLVPNATRITATGKKITSGTSGMTVRYPSETYFAVESAAAGTGQKPNDIVREAILEFIKYTDTTEFRKRRSRKKAEREAQANFLNSWGTDSGALRHVEFAGVTTSPRRRRKVDSAEFASMTTSPRRRRRKLDRDDGEVAALNCRVPTVHLEIMDMCADALGVSMNDLINEATERWLHVLREDGYNDVFSRYLERVLTAEVSLLSLDGVGERELEHVRAIVSEAMTLMDGVAAGRKALGGGPPR